MTLTPDKARKKYLAVSCANLNRIIELTFSSSSFEGGSASAEPPIIKNEFSPLLKGGLRRRVSPEQNRGTCQKTANNSASAGPPFFDDAREEMADRQGPEEIDR